ncbi:O-antigen ligase domain-containing protein [Azospirillum formosense]|uniref:O-antigen ligase domain-containing protein n=1 Tax=Azospirillum formosense TaxID=861533 RepID=A0ABX2KR33_9PROT|nr:O-antigen ligase family protein [Azospirillum formosense]MBY3755948.1 O-antigen ligase family protein [Azospirillum formosense]NUB18595.1 O-antigen ligase domain-containing protein [Azospirillum formosense]
MSAVLSTPKRSRTRAADLYLGFLMVVLLGYTLAGRGFAYIGMPPLFIGEILLLTGLLVMLRTGGIVATLSSLPGTLLAILIVWVLARTIPFLGLYSFDALRDSVIVMYGLFAFIVVVVLYDEPERLRRLVLAYGSFAVLFVSIMPIVYPGYQLLQSQIPIWPRYNVPLISLRPGEVGVHFAGIALFVLLGFRRLGPVQLALLVVGIAMVAAHSRGGTLAIVVPLCIALAMVPRSRQLAPLLMIAAAIVTIAALLNVEIEVSSRKLSVDQIVTNLMSIAGSAETAGLDGTKQWRIMWWDKIINYTVHGDNFWNGKGFGINLADDDGFQVIDEEEAQVLRSPHNAHMTILARSGVPGFVLWVAMLGSWVAFMVRAFLLARRHGDRAWARLFVFLLCYWLSIVINASFDVALEGPMLGIWFWVLFGTGIAAGLIHRTEIEGRTGGRATP